MWAFEGAGLLMQEEDTLRSYPQVLLRLYAVQRICGIPYEPGIVSGTIHRLGFH